MRPFSALALALLLAACGDGEPLSPADARLPDGSRYRGELVDGRLHGAGRLDHPDGAWYQGDFQNGRRHGWGEWHGPEGESYRGDFADGQFAGLGVLEHADGSRYEGQFQAGRYHGLGVLHWPDGSRHQGRFEKGQAQGQGLRTDALGNRYSGHFQAGLLEGEGNLAGADGERYSGGFAADLFDGDGRYETAAGDVWHGRFSAGSASGQGEYQGADGEHYRGDFRDWRYHGGGRLSLADGSRYDGHFRAGRYHGEGTLRSADGTQLAGRWQNGNLLQDAQGVHVADPLDLALLEQGRLLQTAIDRLPASTADAELYALTLAGDGSQSVFLREADFVDELLRERFAARGVISLVNHRDHLQDRPMATAENLRRALEALARSSGEEDLIFLYLTSHGSADHQFMLGQPRLQLRDLPAAQLAELLEPLAGRHKVVVISACYSGGFIDALKNDKTLIMTAARADRTSFGCSEQSDFTYFGRALFAEALQQTDDLQAAFELARQYVAKREQEDQFEASEPQIWAPDEVLQHWQALMRNRSLPPAAPQAGDGRRAVIEESR